MNLSKDKKTILVVEDEYDILFSVKSFLESEGYEVFTAQNGQEAFELLKKKKMPHLILLDMKMPTMDGWEFSRRFYKAYDNKAPLIVMTAAANAEERAREAHANGWIGKPFTLEDVSDQIKKFT
ncbi:response regulator [bacterium]|nr:response regulator [bacterium]